MKYILTFIFCIGFLSTSISFGQAETKKVVIVKKTVDKDGVTTTERQEASGTEADVLIEKMKEDGTLDGVDIDVEIEKAKKSGAVSKTKIEDISIEKSITNGKEITTYKVVTEKDGQKEVSIWKSDDGEIPEEMAKKLESIDIETDHINGGKEMRIQIDATGASGEDEEVHESYTVEKKIIVEHKNDNKVSLGVMIEDDSKGVVISNVVDDSAAAKMGLQKGDTILKVNDTYIFNTNMLLSALGAFDKGDEVQVTYLRDGKEMKSNTKF